MTAPEKKLLSFTSPAFVMVVLLALFLLFLGVRGMLGPASAAHGFGIDLVAPADAFFLRVKADRDLALGASLLALAIYRRPMPLALFVAATLVAPIADAALVASDPRGSVVYALAVHGSAALYGVVLSALLLRHARTAHGAPS